MIEQNVTGHLVLIMAPSGSGKGYLISRIKEHFADQIKFAVSCTSRSMRAGEKEGETYHFITREAFNEMIYAGEFLEWAEFSGNLYGTLKSEIMEPLKNGEVVVREVDLQGVLAIREIIPLDNRTVIFIDAGPWDLLKKRIIARAPISAEELEMRRQRYEEESASKPYADIILNNEEGHVEKAEAELKAIITNILEKVHT